MGRWLLEVDHGRDVARWASPGPTSSTVGLGHQVGTACRYVAGLELGEVEIPEGADASIAITLTRAGPQLTLPDLERLEGSPALLRRQLDDGALLTILRGIVVDVERGAVDEPVTFSLEAPPAAAAGLIPDPAAAVGEATWPVSASFTLCDDDVGRVPPRIIGAPGLVAGSLNLEGAPAILAELRVATAAGTVIVADGRVGATQVRLFCPQSRDDGYDYAEILSIAYMDDLAGRKVATVTPSAAMAAPAKGQTYYAGWPVAGGMLSPRTGLAVRGWAEVVEAVLTERGYPVDVARLRGEAHLLDRYLLDLYWDASTSARDLVEGLLAVVPGIRTMRSERGEWWRAPTWQRPAWEAEADVIVGRGATRLGPVRSRVPEGGILNDVSVSFAGTVPGGPTQLVRLTAAADTADSRIVADPRAARSQARYGVRAYTADLPTWDRSTAELHASGVLAIGAAPRTGVAMALRATARAERLAPGSLVAVTDSALGWSGLAAEVEAVTLGGSEVKLDLTLL